MKKLTIFETNGKRFDSYEDALKYEKLCKKVDGIMSQLLPRTKEIEQGTDYNKHNKETLNGCFKAFCKECAKQIPDNEAMFMEVANGIRHMSHMGRILSDYSYNLPCLYDAYHRFNCTDFNTGFEFQQPYYVTHQDEFFNNIKSNIVKNKGYVRLDKVYDWIKQQQDLLEDSFSDAGDFADLLKEAMEEQIYD